MTGLVNRRMTFGQSSGVWTDLGSFTPITTHGTQGTMMHSATSSAGPVFVRQDAALGLVVELYSPATNNRVTTQVTTPGFTAMVPERYQQYLDMRASASGFVLCYDDTGRLVRVAYGATLGPPGVAIGTAQLIANVPGVAPGTAVGIAFDAKRRRWVLFTPSGVTYVDLRSGNPISAGPLPDGIASFDRAIWDPYRDVIVCWGDPGDPSKFHRFQFTDNDLSDQPGNLKQGQLWDLGSGTNVTYFNVAAGMPWVNSGGDFTDTTGVAQASGTPYQTFTFQVNTTQETISRDVTSLVAAWISQGNTGAIISQPGTLDIYTRYNITTPPTAPTLSVVTANGTFNCAPTATGCTDGSGPFPLPTGNPSAGSTVMTASGVKKIFLQFDLSQVTGALTSATLTLTKKRLADSSQPAKVLRCTPPLIQTDNFAPATSGTIASGYPYDGFNPATGTYAIASDPRVLLFDNMTSGWSSRLNQFGNAGEGSFQTNGTDSYLGGGGYGQYGLEYGIASAFSSGNVITFYTNSIPDPTDCYARYVFYFDKDWASVITGTKMPGFSWIYTSGPASKEPQVPYPGSLNGEGNGAFNGSLCKVVVSGGKGPYFSGGTARMHLNAGGPPEPTDLNPYRKIISMFSTESCTDPNDDIHPHYFTSPVSLRRGRYYSIEQHIRMNTIDMSSPDQYGNGVGNPDGLYECWIEDKLVLSYTNIVFSHHPSYKLNGFWLTVQHGGNESPQANHTFRLANLCIATSRVGAVKSQPSWLVNVPPFQWVSIPNSSYVNQVPFSSYLSNYNVTIDGNNDVHWTPNKYNQPNSTSNDTTPALRPYRQTFSGMAVDTVGSRVFMGAGDAGVADNSYHVFNYGKDSPSWDINFIRGSMRADYKQIPELNSTTTPPSLPGDYVGLDRYYDARHRGGHTYWCAHFISALNGIIHIEQHNTWDGDRYSLANVHFASLTTRDWETTIPSTFPDMPFGGTGDTQAWKWKHELTEDIYQTGANDRILVFRQATKSWQTIYHFTTAPVFQWGTVDLVGGINWEQNWILFIGFSGSGANTPVNFVLQLDTPDAQGNLATLTNVTLTGPAVSIFQPATQGPSGKSRFPMVWCPDLQCFLGYKDDGVVYRVTRLDATTIFIDSITTTNNPAAGVIGVNIAGGVLSNFNYDRNLHGMILRIGDTPQMLFMKTR